MPASTRSKTKKPANRPVHDIRMGRIRAAIWLNETEIGLRHNVTISRLYKDGDEWRDSTSFGRDDLPLVAKVVDLCHTWIFEHGAGRNGEGREHGEEFSNGNGNETPF